MTYIDSYEFWNSVLGWGLFGFLCGAILGFFLGIFVEAFSELRWWEYIFLAPFIGGLITGIPMGLLAFFILGIRQILALILICFRLAQNLFLILINAFFAFSSVVIQWVVIALIAIISIVTVISLLSLVISLSRKLFANEDNPEWANESIGAAVVAFLGGSILITYFIYFSANITMIPFLSP